MNITFIVAFISAFVLVMYGMVSGGTSISQVMSSFIDIPSIFITFGGAFSATVMSVPMKDLKDIPKHMKILLKKEKIDINQYIEVIVELAREARLKGLLVLEEKIKTMDIKDEFLEYCTMLIIDAIEPSKVRSQIENEIDCIEIRHARAWNVYDKLGSFGPAFGMLGTLIGLINMLANMNTSGGSDALGKGMAVALVTTFYGSVLVNMVCAPVSNRLKAKHEEEMIVKELIMEGVLSIQSGENPKYIKEKLNSYLTYQERETSNAGDGATGKKKGSSKKERKSSKNQVNNA